MRPLPAVLLDLYEDLVTGKLVLRRGRVSKTVELVNGNPVSSTSTPRDETLGHFLVNSGVITEDQHRSAVGRAAEDNNKLGETLVAMRILTVEQLIEQLGRQARHKIVQALRWPQGAWRFDDGDAVEGIQLRMVEIVVGGLRETAIELDRLARLDGQSFVLTERGVRIKHELKRAFGDRVMTALGTPTPIGDIEKLFPDRVQARLAVDTMLVCDALALQVDDDGLGLGAVPGAEPSVGRAPTRPQAPGSALFDILFDDIDNSPPVDAAAPLELDNEDSGIVSTAELTAASSGRDLTATIRKSVTAEHQRVRVADHYSVLMIGRRATTSEIEAAYQIRTSLLDRDTANVSDPKDKKRVDEVRALYDDARKVLADERRRGAYDRELAGGELVQAPPAINAELAFKVAEELMGKRQWAQAIGHIKTVLSQAPNEADFHAALGWAEWMASGETHLGGDTAKDHLNAALAINPDHPASHDFLGRIEAKLGTDDTEALFHLERALDLDPARKDALTAIEGLLIGRGELRRLEKILKRLLFRLRGRGTVVEGKAWARLARLYFDHLDDPTAGSAALSNARRIAPKDSDVAQLAARGEQVKPTEPLRAGWHEALSDPQSGAMLVRNVEVSGHADAAFLAASTMVALGTADGSMSSLYDARRVRTGVPEPRQALDRDQWAMLRHRDDTVELGALIELVAPAVHALAPMLHADAELDASQLVPDAELPPAFAKLRARYATLLGVAAAPVYARVELGFQIHVVATDPPVLIAGDEALTAPERPELAFRLARAMTFLWPGRAVGASRPGRVLRAVVLAVFREASDSPIGADEPNAEAATKALAALDAQRRVQARAASMRILSRGNGLNLSLWGRSLTRTADRAGMLLCGDVPAGFTGAREVGELDRDLIEFSYSAAHVHLRQQLGLLK